MADVPGFIWAGLAGGGLSAGLLAVAAVLGKSQLAHWLNKDIERIKSQHQIDLEAYKFSLIASVERTKASQDVQKSMALLVAEKKFHALDRLNQAVSLQAPKLVMLLMTIDHDNRSQRITEWMQDFHEMTTATQAASSFISPEDMKLISEFSMSMNKYIPPCIKTKPDMSPSEVNSITETLLLQQARVNDLLKQRLNGMLSMC
jgi:hypothetical protein